MLRIIAFAIGKNAHYFTCSKQSVKLYLHRDGQFLDLTGRMGYKILAKERMESQV